MGTDETATDSGREVVYHVDGREIVRPRRWFPVAVAVVADMLVIAYPWVRLTLRPLGLSVDVACFDVRLPAWLSRWVYA